MIYIYMYVYIDVYISATVPGACGGNEVECPNVRAEGPQPCSLGLNQLINLRGPRGSGLHTPAALYPFSA